MLRSVFAALACAAVLVAGVARAQVSCDSPDALCTGDPCVTGDVEVISPCNLDFGNRKLVIGRPLHVDTGGELALSAASIEVRAPIVGRHTRFYRGDGASISLRATNEIIVARRIDVSARNNPGKITIEAGGTIELRASLRARAKGHDASAPGGDVFVDAGGTLLTSGRGRVDVRGGLQTNGGSIHLSGNHGISTRAPLDSRGAAGGVVDLASDAGGIVVGDELRAAGLLTGGGVITVAASGGLVLRSDATADGLLLGGSVNLQGDSVSTDGTIRVLGRDAGGSVNVTGNRSVLITGKLRADGGDGGTILVSSPQGSASLNNDVLLSGSFGDGGTLTLITSGLATISDIVRADGRRAGGNLQVVAGSFLLTGQANVLASGDSGGMLRVIATTASTDTGSSVRLDGRTRGGEARFVATTGDLRLRGILRVRGDSGGLIEASAAGDLTAAGQFYAASGGCISFSADGNSDTAGGTFDVTPVDSCP
jgi:hypothetical protein